MLASIQGLLVIAFQSVRILVHVGLCPKIFRFEKRKYMRIPNDFAKRMSLKITNGNSVEYFKLDNVSPEGAAMILSSEKQRLFSPKSNFKNVVLELNDLIFKIFQVSCLPCSRAFKRNGRPPQR